VKLAVHPLSQSRPRDSRKSLMCGNSLIVRAPCGMLGWLNSAMCEEIMEFPSGIATGMGLGSGRMLLRNRELNVNLPKLSEAAQSITVSVCGPNCVAELLLILLLC
jgi:hypothetical protein